MLGVTSLEQLVEIYKKYYAEEGAKASELNAVVDEAIQTTKEFTPDAIPHLTSLYSWIMNTTMQKPFESKPVKPFWEIAERIAAHVPKLMPKAAEYLIKEAEKAGYKPSLNLQTLLSFFEHKADIPFSMFNGKDEYWVSLNENGFYVCKLDGKPHGATLYPYSKLSSVSQILLSFD